MSLYDTFLISLLHFGMGLSVISIASLILSYVIALKAPPSRRAAWIAGVAYVVTVGFFIFGGSDSLALSAPLICLPAALIVFLYWRWDFRRGWIEDPDNLHEDISLANDDWRIGILVLLAALVAAFHKMLLSYVF